MQLIQSRSTNLSQAYTTALLPSLVGAMLAATISPANILGMMDIILIIYISLSISTNFEVLALVSMRVMSATLTQICFKTLATENTCAKGTG